MITAIERSREKADRIIENIRSRTSKASSPAAQLTSGVTGGTAFGEDRSAGSAKAQYDRNTSWTYAAVRPIMNRVAAQQVKVARIVEQDAKGAMSRRDFAAVPQSVKNHASKSMHMPSAASLEILEHHPLLDALHDPNDVMTFYSLMSLLASSLQLAGRAYWWITRSKRKGYEDRNDIWSIPAHWVTPNHSEGFRASWTIQPAGSQASWDVSGDSMAYFSYPKVSDPFGSYAPVEAGARDILTDEAIKESQHRSFENDIVPGLAITLGNTAIGVDGKAVKPMAEAHQIAQLEARLNQLYSGSHNSRKFILLDRLVDKVDRISTAPNEMDYQDSGKMVKNAIMQIFGVNSIIAGEIEGANRASAVVADETFLANVVNPLLSLVTEILNKTVVPLYQRGEEKIVAWMEPGTATDPAERRADWTLAEKMRAVTRDEVRAGLLGLPPLPNETGNSFVMGVGEIIQPAGEEQEVAVSNVAPETEDEQDEAEGKGVFLNHVEPKLFAESVPALPPMNFHMSMPPANTVINVAAPAVKVPDVTIHPTSVITSEKAEAPVVQFSPEIVVQPADVLPTPLEVNVQASDVAVTPQIDINVETPTVIVEPPTVNVTSPAVNVEAPDVTVNVDADGS